MQHCATPLITASHFGATGERGEAQCSHLKRKSNGCTDLSSTESLATNRTVTVFTLKAHSSNSQVRHQAHKIPCTTFVIKTAFKTDQFACHSKTTNVPRRWTKLAKEVVGTGCSSSVNINKENRRQSSKVSPRPSAR